ncbi:MAG: hypothetical protein E7370_05665 [Clostridiales bacterium]|nr:hypothetical protein [Clostridiales bacterium]
MSINKIKAVRADKGFRIADLIAYGAIALLIVFLFVATAIIFGEAEPLTGVKILYTNKDAYTIDFETGEQNIIMPEKIKVEEETEVKIILRFYLAEDLSDYNIIEINKVERSATVTQADCSTRKDCVYMEKITDTSKVIMCTPHALKIVPFDFEEPEDDGIIIV